MSEGSRIHLPKLPRIAYPLLGALLILAVTLGAYLTVFFGPRYEQLHRRNLDGVVNARSALLERHRDLLTALERSASPCRFDEKGKPTPNQEHPRCGNVGPLPPNIRVVVAAGNTYIGLDRASGKVLYAAPPAAKEKPAEEKKDVLEVVQFETDLRQLLAELGLGDLFETTLLLLEQDGQVVASLASEETPVTTLDVKDLKPGTENERAPGKPVESPTVLSLSIRDESFMLFRERIDFASVVKDPKVEQEDLSPLVLCGLIRQREALRQALQIPYHLALFGSLILLLGFLSLPITRFAFLSADEDLRVSDVLRLALSSSLILMLLTLTILDLFFYWRLQATIRHQLAGVATRLTQGFQRERQLIDAVLAEVEDAPEKNITNALTGADLRGHAAFREYPYFDYLFAADVDGKVTQWITPQPTEYEPSPGVGDRPYFKAVTQPAPARSAAGDPLLFPLVDRLEALPRAVATRHRWAVDEDKHWFLLTRMTSLSHVLLPPGFLYAVFGPDGRVAFHSAEHKNLRENFLAACERQKWLLAATSARSRRDGSLSYMGRPYLALVQPIPETPWMLAVLADKTPTRTVNLHAVSSAALLAFGAWLTVSFPVFVIWARSLMKQGGLQSQLLAWIWPSDRSARRYLRGSILIGTAALVTLASVGNLGTRRLLMVLAFCLAVPLAIVPIALAPRSWAKASAQPTRMILGSILFLGGCVFLRTGELGIAAPLIAFTGGLLALSLEWVPGRDWPERFRDWLKGHNLGVFSAFACALALALFVLPAVVAYKVAFQHDMDLMVRRGQLDLAAQMSARRTRLLLQYENLVGKPYAKPSPDNEAFQPILETRLLSSIDVAASPWYKTLILPIAPRHPAVRLPDDRSLDPSHTYALFARLHPLLTDTAAANSELFWPKADDGAWQFKAILPLGKWGQPYGSKWTLRAGQGLRLVDNRSVAFSSDPRESQSDMVIDSVAPAVALPFGAPGWTIVVLAVVVLWLAVRSVARKLFLMSADDASESEQSTLEPFWEDLSAEERTVLRQLATSGFVNPKLGKAARKLERRNLLRNCARPELSAADRAFVLRQTYRVPAATAVAQAPESAAASVKASQAGTLVVFVLLGLLAAVIALQPDLVNSSMTWLAGVVAVLGNALRLFDSFRRPIP
jgi:hypothetical protein